MASSQHGTGPHSEARGYVANQRDHDESSAVGTVRHVMDAAVNPRVRPEPDPDGRWRQSFELTVVCSRSAHIMLWIDPDQAGRILTGRADRW